MLGALLSLAASCAPKHSAPTKAKAELGIASVAPSAAASGALSCGAASTAGAPKLSDPGLIELVAHWRRAQKNHDFAAYSALYAEHFTGSLGAGAGFVDRATWLRAHDAALALEPALLSATAHIALGVGGAQVTFSPQPAPASSARLPELFVVSTAGGPKIAREAPARSAPNELSDSRGPWLADERFALLSLAPDPSWAEGTPSYAGQNIATSPVALMRLPKALRAWLGRPVRVLGESGIVCETRLQRFAIRAQVSPDWASAEAWDGCADHAPEPTSIARDIWQWSSVEGRTLVAEFSVPCQGALLAVDPELAAPPIAAPQPASSELGAAALAAFRKLRAYARIQARFETDSPDSAGAWEDRGRRSVWSLALPGRTPLVFVSAQAGQACARFSASLSALWEVLEGEGNASLALVAVPGAEDSSSRLTPRALIDLGPNGGAALLLGPDGVYRARSVLSKTHAGYRQTLLTSVPFFAGCADIGR